MFFTQFNVILKKIFHCVWCICYCRSHRRIETSSQDSDKDFIKYFVTIIYRIVFLCFLFCIGCFYCRCSFCARLICHSPSGFYLFNFLNLKFLEKTNYYNILLSFHVLLFIITRIRFEIITGPGWILTAVYFEYFICTLNRLSYF